MDKIVMNSVEKQVFSQICLGNVIRKTLINVITERNICSVPTLDRTLKKFQRCGLVVKGERGRYPLTDEGRKEKKHREVKPTVTFDNSGLTKVVEKLPTEAHRGLIYFILATIVAKKYLAEKLRDKGIWGSFIISGRPKDIKTLLGEIVCRTLDLPFKKHIQRAIGKTEAQVLGEATLIEDGLRKLRLPPYFSYPFLVWDDLDKASDKRVWVALLVYLDGRYEFEERNTDIIKKVTVLATMNPKKEQRFDIQNYYLRRAFVVNSVNLPCDQKENEIIGADIADNPIPKLKIDGLVAVKERLTKDEGDFVRDLLYDRWITKEAKGIVDSKLLHAVILGMLILKKSVDVRYYSYWAVLHYLCFLETLGYTKGNWQEELSQEWGDYAVGSGGDEKFKKEWEEQAKKVKEEKAKVDEGKKKIKVVVIDKDAEERATIAKYTPKIDRLKEIKTNFEEMNGDKQHTVLLYLSMDLKKFRGYLPTEKRDNKVTEDVLRSLEIVLDEWEEQYKPIREAWEAEQKRKAKAKETFEGILRWLTEQKTGLNKWRGYEHIGDSKGALWTKIVKPTIAKIGNVLSNETQKKFYNMTYLEEIRNDITALGVRVRTSNEALERKKKGLVTIPQLPFDLEDLEEESEAGIGATIEQVGQPIKGRTVKYWQYLLMKLDQKLRGKRKVKAEPINIRGKGASTLLDEFDYERQEGGEGKGYMGRDINEL